MNSEAVLRWGSTQWTEMQPCTGEVQTMNRDKILWTVKKSYIGEVPVQTVNRDSLMLVKNRQWTVKLSYVGEVWMISRDKILHWVSTDNGQWSCLTLGKYQHRQWTEIKSYAGKEQTMNSEAVIRWGSTDNEQRCSLTLGKNRQWTVKLFLCWGSTDDEQRCSLGKYTMHSEAVLHWGSTSTDNEQRWSLTLGKYRQWTVKLSYVGEVRAVNGICFFWFRLQHVLFPRLAL